jgi:hypothetical protein
MAYAYVVNTSEDGESTKEEETMEYVANILAVYKQATYAERNHGKVWYRDAQDAAQAIADKHELPLAVVVGVIAALSPTNRWERNLVDADNLCEAYVSGGYEADVAVCTYKTMRTKAWKILQDGPELDAQTIANILNGPKITDFFWCILGHDTCVIDGHAWCIANADRRAMQEVPNIGKKLRKELQDAYTVAAEAVGMRAFEMQAATWVAWKRLHNV